jgi:hypothetical protein
MLIASSDAPKRPDYNYEKASGGTMIGWPKSSRPYINRNHIDGPLLYMRNGELHWLTFGERVALMFGWVDALSLERKYKPQLSIDD